MKIRLATSLTVLAVLTFSLFTAAGSARPLHNSAPVFGETAASIPFDFSLTYDTSKGSQMAFYAGTEDFYGYSAAGITAYSLTFGTKTWTVDNLQADTIDGNLAHFWTNADLTLGAPTRLAAYFGDADGSLALGRVLETYSGYSLSRSTGIEEEIPGFAYAIAEGSYSMSTTFTPSAVPEPASLLFVGSGLLGLVARRRMSKKR
jgi:PEP-CTERM motif-containing protein